MSFSKIIPIVILILFIIFAVAIIPQINGSIEAGQNQNLSQDYKNQINSTRDISMTTVVMTRYITPVLGVLILIIAISYINKKRK